MKPKSVDAFLKAIPASISAILIYGPDQGMVRERAIIACKTAVNDLNDPFNVSELSADKVTDDAALLSDEMATQSLMGGRRLVRIKDAGDSIAKNLKTMLDEDSRTDTLLVIEAGELRGGKNSLRDVCEQHDKAAALPCYEATAQDIIRFASEQFRAAGISITPDGNTLLASLLASDRGVARGEIDKLITYAGQTRKLDESDINAAIGNSSTLNFDAAAWAAASGKLIELDRALDRLYAEGTSTVAIIRAAQRHFLRLYEVVASDDPFSVAVKSLRPPLFWKDEDRFRAQAEMWKRDRLEDALQRLIQAELDCKRTGLPDTTMCARALMGIAGLARAR